MTEPPPLPASLSAPLADFLRRCLVVDPVHRTPIHQLRGHEFVLQV